MSLIAFVLCSQLIHRYLLNRAASTIDDLWDFGTVRNVQPRGGTLRKHQAAMAAAATSNPPPARPPRADRDQPPAPGTGVRVRDYAVNPPKAQPDAFDTVRQAPSAHSEYSEFSSSASVPGDVRARIELDREKARIERERQLQVQKEQQQSAARTAIQHSKSRSWDSVGSSVEHHTAVGPGNGGNGATAGPTSVHSSDDEEGDSGSIMDTVVIPVLDSVCHHFSSCLVLRLRFALGRFTTEYPMLQHKLRFSDFEEQFKKLRGKFPDSSMFSYQRLSIRWSQSWMIE